MALLSVVVIAENQDQLLLLKTLVEATGEAQVKSAVPRYPSGGSDAIIRGIAENAPDIVIVDIPARTPSAALACIQLLRHEFSKTAIFAMGQLSRPEIIIEAMRGGAQEFLDSNTSASTMLEALVRFASSKRAVRSTGTRGKIVVVLNSKGGSGGTTVAVNMGLAFQQDHGNTILMDIAPLGNAALHLNVRPVYTYVDALQNLHRLDSALLDSYIARCHGGMHLLAGVEAPQQTKVPESEFTRLLDLLADQYRFVVVDVSSRLDHVVRVVCEASDLVLLVLQTDVASLWSASRIHDFLGEGISSDRVRVVLNRYRKISGFDDTDIEAATRLKILWKIPNHFAAVADGIDRGIPVAQQNHSAIARSFVALCAEISPQKAEPKTTSWLSLGR